jgi:hypothetical protein
VRSFLIAPLLAGSMFVALGCRNSSGIYPVRGKVLYRGEPAVGATVTFVRKGVAKGSKEHPSQGVVGADGTFSLASPLGSGALPGEYAVLVEWKVGADKIKGRGAALSAADRLDRRYLDPAKPLLSATVEPKTNILQPFELK